MKRKRKHKRRFWRVPQLLVNKYIRLLQETNYSITECMRRAGVTSSHLQRIAMEVRQQLGKGRWIDKKTGERRPKTLLTTQDIAVQAGMSPRTVERRRRAGLLKPARATSHRRVRAYSERDVDALLSVGLNPPDSYSDFTRADILRIHELSAQGWTGSQIAAEYNHVVSVRQINRIRRGDRWKI